MMTNWMSTFVIAGLLAAGCTSKAAAPSGAAKATPTPAVTAAPPAPAPPASAPVVDPVLAKAMAAAAAAATGATPCEQAYNGLRGLVDAMAKSGGPAKVLDRAKYIAVCQRFPEAMQRCMTPKHGMEHQAECARLLQTADPKLTAQMQALMLSEP